MTLAEALDVVIVRSGHGRYRWLCSDANPDPETRAGYRRLVLEMAGAPAPGPESLTTPEDAALRAHVARHGGCCGG